jgi:magnesium transporter
MIRTLLYDAEQHTWTEGDEEQIAAWQANPNSHLWIDFYQEDPESEGVRMRDEFGLHPLAITDAQRERHPAKIEAFDDHTFVLLKGLSADTTTMDFATIQIAIFVGNRFLLTRHTGPSVSIDALWAEVMESMEAGAKNSTRLQPDSLAVRLTRLVVNRYIPILLDLEKRLDAIEQEMISHPEDALLFELIEHKTNLKKMRRIMAYHTDVFGQLKSGAWPAIGAERDHEINDVYEQLERATSLASLYHELISDLQDGYISLASHRLNNIVKVLTIITVIFVPLGFLAGLYGMNFEYIPELHYEYSYFVILAVMVTIAASLLLVFKRMKWL